MSIYDDVAELEKKLDNCYDLETGEIDEKAEAQILVAMQELFEDGLEKLCKIRANRLSYIDALKSEEKRINEKRKYIELKLGRLEKHIFDVYKLAKQEKIKAGTFSLSMRKSESVVLTDSFVNPDFGTFEFKPDKKKIKEAIKGGIMVDGAEIVEKENLQIK